MRFPQRRRQENSSGGQALAWGPTLLPTLSPFQPFSTLPSHPFLPRSFPSSLK